MTETFLQIATVVVIGLFLVASLTAVAAAAMIFISGLEPEDYLDD